MEQKIVLSNGYFIARDISNIEFSNNIIDIKEIGKYNCRKRGPICLKIDFSTLDTREYKYILRKLFNITKRKYVEIGLRKNSEIFLGVLLNYKSDNKEYNDFLDTLNAIFFKEIYDMYNYIYDIACNFLDRQFDEMNLCDFKNNKCIEKRCTNSESLTGCCNHYKHKMLAILIPNNKLVPCEYLKNKKCTAKCISCKLFTCNTIEKKRN